MAHHWNNNMMNILFKSVANIFHFRGERISEVYAFQSFRIQSDMDLVILNMNNN